MFYALALMDRFQSAWVDHSSISEVKKYPNSCGQKYKIFLQNIRTYERRNKTVMEKMTET
jgi:hypothetical protein